MSKEKTHDLHDFMQQKSDWLAAEYRRIQKRAPEDPGTAGDQGENNWADLLRGWLPYTYHVETKGRIISQDGRTSPQIDVVVLKSMYPKELIEKNKKCIWQPVSLPRLNARPHWRQHILKRQ